MRGGRLGTACLFALGLAGCRDVFGMLDPEPLGPVDAETGHDAVTDGIPPDGVPACSLWQPKYFDACAIPAPQGDLILSAAGAPYTFDTSTLQLRNGTNGVVPLATIALTSSSGPIAVMSVTSFRIDAGVTLTVSGSYPLIIASWGIAGVFGTIDAGSHQAGTTGPGANLSCGALAGGNGATGLSSGGSGGGGGGGFHGMGGDGGRADSPNNLAGGMHGTSTAVPAKIRGGCGGGGGGKAGPGVANPNATTSGGAGGGALVIAAKVAVNIEGDVLAGGAGGEGAPINTGCGGGGGGSGGLIALDAPGVNVAGIVAANGGGGGASSEFATAGHAGADGQPSATAAAGGAQGSSNCGPPGGNGGAGPTSAGSTSSGYDACGGGGGGGAAGYILVWSPAFMKTGGATISPPELVNWNGTTSHF